MPDAAPPDSPSAHWPPSHALPREFDAALAAPQGPRGAPAALTRSAALGWVILAFGATSIAVELLRTGSNQWLFREWREGFAAGWFILFFAWVLLCRRSLALAIALLLITLPLFGARPGDLLTNVQDSLVLATAAVSLWRYPLQPRRAPLAAGWLLAAVALLSILANAHRCLWEMWPFNRHNYTSNFLFMFAESWDWTIGLSEWWMLVMFLLVARAAAILVRRGQLRLAPVAAAMTAMLALGVLVGLADYFSRSAYEYLFGLRWRLYAFCDNDPPHWNMPAWLRSPAEPHSSMKAFFANRTWYAMYLSAVAPLCLGWTATRRHAALRWLTLPLALLILAAVALCGARSVLLAAAAGLIGLALYHALARAPFARRLAAHAVTYVVLALMLAATAAALVLLHRTTRQSLVGDANRALALDKTIRLIRDNPLFGVGYESFGLAAREIPPDTEYKFITTHNFLSQTLVTTGPLGLLALMLLFALPVERLLRAIARRGAGLDPLVTALSFSYMTLFVCSQAQDWFYQHSMALFWWVGLGMLAGYREVEAAPAGATGTGPASST